MRDTVYRSRKGGALGGSLPRSPGDGGMPRFFAQDRWTGAIRDAESLRMTDTGGRGVGCGNPVN